MSWLDALPAARGKAAARRAARALHLAAGGRTRRSRCSCPPTRTISPLSSRALPAEVPVTVLGVGSNVIVRDGGIEGLVDPPCGQGLRRTSPSTAAASRIVAGAGGPRRRRWRARRREAGIAGLEFFAGIPGTIGGAVTMNAGCYGSRDQGRPHRGLGRRPRAARRRVFDAGGPRPSLSSQRHAATASIWTGAIFQGLHDDHEAIGARMDEITARREASQPIREKTGGSTFRIRPAAPRGN